MVGESPMGAAMPLTQTHCALLRRSVILMDQDLTDYCRSIFNSCDRNKDGVISISELRSFIESQEGIDISEELAEKICSHFDKNKDEQLDFDEFLEMINNPVFTSSFQSIMNRILKFIVVPPNNTSNEKKLKLQRTITVTGAYERNSKLTKTTVLMVLVSAIQIFLFFINKSYVSESRSGPYQCSLSFDPCRKYEVYRYLTYSFVHGSEGHLFGNVVIQLLLGIPLETIHKWRVIVIYYAGVLGGCLFHSVIDRTASLIGASAGAYSLLSAHIAAVILNWREMSHPAVNLISFGIIIAADVGYDVISGTMSEISYWAHFGGACVGILLGVNILRNMRVTKIEIVIWHICWITLVVFTIIVFSLEASLPRSDKCAQKNQTSQCTHLYDY